MSAPAAAQRHARVIRLRPYQYIHVIDNNTNVTTVVQGPMTFIRKDHEQVVKTATAMINIPPRSYCVVANPYLRDPETGAPLVDQTGQVKLHHGEVQVRLSMDWKNPFPLYPGESLKERVKMLTVVKPNCALRLYALRDFVDKSDRRREAGAEWLFKGPGTYIPRVEVRVLEEVKSQVVKPNSALRLRARRQCTDRKGTKRQKGEEWLVREQGCYLPDVCEEVVNMVKAHVLTEKTALHLLATHTFVDVYGTKRKAGTEWLVTMQQSQTHIPAVYEHVKGIVGITTLSKQQYCVVLNPVDENGNPQLGIKKLIRGECTFFLQPGESLERGRQDVEILGEDEALLLRAKEQFTELVSRGFGEEEKKEKEADAEAEELTRQPGEEWMEYGPRKYVCPVEVEILDRRRRLPLDKNEGIYVRDKQTGKVRAVTGQSYMLKPNEETWDKELPGVVEDLIAESAQQSQDLERQKHKVVTYRVPHNSAAQIYDYKHKQSRVVFGPELVMLQPDEQFSIISLSGGTPKRPNAKVMLCMPLGPSFMSDTLEVETSDHARLRLRLSYNWRFEVDENDPTQRQAIFSVRDFVGDTCKALGSRIRGAVATKSFDDFHKNSATLIRDSVFGHSADGELAPRLLFSANRLAVTNVDIQSVEPVEQRTRDALQKSVQLAIEIATASQEALASHEAQREDQVARGKLERQAIRDEADAERERKTLVELKAKTGALQSTGQAKAEAIARSEAALIKGRAAVKQAELKAKSMKIRSDARNAQLEARYKQELAHKAALDDLEISKREKEAEIEATKFTQVVKAIGADTIEAIARAGPEMQAKLLEGLGLQGYLVTDGSSPINLFNTANGLVGGNGGGGFKPQ